MKNLNYDTAFGEITYSSVPPIVDTSTKVVRFYHNPSNTMQPFTILPTYKNLTIEIVAGGGSGAFTNSYNGGAAGAGAGGYI